MLEEVSTVEVKDLVSYTPIAQWIEQRFSKPEVESSSLSGGTNVRAARLEEQQLAKLEVGGSTPLADANDLVA